MFGLLTRLLSGAVAPLTDQISDFGARLLKKAALFFVAGVCLLVVLIALTIAFDLWVASRAGAIAGALAVAGVYFAVAVVAIVVALYERPRKDTATKQAKAPAGEAGDTKSRPSRDEQVDQFTAPVLAMLQRLGLRREQLAVLAGASVAKQMGPLPMVGLAILAGFLLGRLVTSWRSLFSMDLITAVLASGLFNLGEKDETEPEDEKSEAA